MRTDNLAPTFIGDTWADIYADIRAALLAQPESVAPRGMSTKELTHTHFVIKNPQSRLGYHPQRGFNLLFAIGETIRLFSNRNGVTALAALNPRIRDFSDDGETLYGAYGYRIAKSFDAACKKLEQDRDSRQAILTIGHPRDLVAETKDFPCTIGIQYLIRDGRLDCHVYMRSNDFMWGTPYDVFVFTVAQEVMANQLEIPLGVYHHSATSLHVYKRHYTKLQNMHTMEPITFAVPYVLADMENLEWIMEMLFTMPKAFDDSAKQEMSRIAYMQGCVGATIKYPLLPFGRILEGEYLHRLRRFDGFQLPASCAWAHPFLNWSITPVAE